MNKTDDVTMREYKLKIQFQNLVLTIQYLFDVALPCWAM